MPTPTRHRARVCIIGAGPHGLAMALHLLAADRGLADQVVAVDPAGDWLSTWQTQFERMEIDVLRSPIVHHPSPDVDGLGRFVGDLDIPRTGLPYDPPSTTAFAGFARQCTDETILAPPIAARATTVTSSGRNLSVETTGPTIEADHLVIAANPHRRNLPSWVAPLLGGTRAEIAHAADVDLRIHDSLEGQRIVIVGGGMSAAHLASGAAGRGAEVHLVARRPIEIRDFDTEPGWLGPKYLRAFEATADPRERLHQALTARGGGTIPGWLNERLQRHERNGRVTVHDNAEITHAEPDSTQCAIHLRRGPCLAADRIWLATGTTPHLAALRCVAPLLPDIATVEGYPVTDAGLRTGRHPVYAMGRLATLSLGPAAGNLWGARHAARRITRAITGREIDPMDGRIRLGKRSVRP